MLSFGVVLKWRISDDIFKSTIISEVTIMETLESTGIFLAGLSGSIFLLATTDEVTKRTGRQSKEKKEQE